MESIILNLLNLTGEERAAFAVLAPQRFHPDGDGLTVEDWQSAQVILGDPPPECLRGSTALRWLHPQCRGGPLYRPRRPALGGGADLLHRGLRPFGVGTPVRTAAGAYEAPAQLPGPAPERPAES